ncbi:hypothetical protein OF83DRAFT_644042 [Amylostereum chailletii]|nr:hypothetical protein OF83DRAFT_644042 [Amylostereum chailletii]
MRNLVLYSFTFLFLVICVPRASAQQTFFPSSVPLFFRSPYVYAYIRTGNQDVHSNVWPRLSSYVPSLGWTGLIKVDNGTTYLWQGDTGSVAGTNDTVLKYSTVTPTRTIFTIQAGPLELNITYLSPIEPDDFVKQSIPFAYLAFEARSTDGSPHHMQVYTGITGEWLNWDHSQNHTWATTPTANGSQIHSFGYSTPQEFAENNGLASWGTPYYATRRGTGVTYRIGITQPGPTLFVNQGVLDNSVDPGAPRRIDGDGDGAWTSLTFAHDLGTIESTSSPIVWAFGHTFDSDNTSAIQYQDLSGNPPQRRSLYYVTQYSDDHTLIDDFLNDFPAALERAIQFDANLTNAATSTIPGTEYSDLIALATRQAVGFTSLTIGKGSDGLWNKSDVMMFWRDVDNGTPEQANPPDGLYSSFPMFLHLNPSLGAPLLEPLLRFQNSPAYTKSTPYAAANIGRSRPNMTANNSYHNQGSEPRATGDTSLVGQYYQLLKSWADYLLTPATTIFNNGQMSADGLAIANQTNLAIKGIIAIKAMSMIANLTGNTADATTYSVTNLEAFTLSGSLMHWRTTDTCCSRTAPTARPSLMDTTSLRTFG